VNYEWEVPVVVLRVVDGDTVWVTADLGWRIRRDMAVRVAHINAPETSTAAGRAARDHAAEVLPLGLELRMTSHKLDKYGRSLSSLRLVGLATFPSGTPDFGTEMLNAGHAVPYEGT
jgi:endonuclease YncB( thermonuclease family)